MNILQECTDSDFPLRNTYISIPLPDDMKERFGAHIATLSSLIPSSLHSTIRFQDPNTAHITFHFIGTLDAEQFETLKREVHTFYLKLLGLPLTISDKGQFSNRILYYRIESPKLNILFEEWHQAFPHWPFDQPSFQPHITLARFSGAPQECKICYDHISPFHETFMIKSVEIAGIYRGQHQIPIVRFV